MPPCQRLVLGSQPHQHIPTQPPPAFTSQQHQALSCGRWTPIGCAAHEGGSRLRRSAAAAAQPPGRDAWRQQTTHEPPQGASLALPLAPPPIYTNQEPTRPHTQQGRWHHAQGQGHTKPDSFPHHHQRQQWNRQYDNTCKGIKACQSWFELRDIYECSSADMDHIQLTALLSGLAKTAPSEAAPGEEARSYNLLARDVLTQVATTHGVRLRAREISTALWAAAKARVSPDCWGDWLPQLLAAASSQLPAGFNPQDLSMLLWALATLEEGADAPALPTPSPFMHGLGNDMGRPHTMGQGMPPSRRRCLQLPDSFLHDVLLAASSRMPAFGAQAVSNTLWALAKLAYRPTDAWLHAALIRMEATMSAFTPQALCNVAWALVVLEHRPPASWCHSFLYHSSLVLESAEPKVLAQLLWSTARLKLSPGPAWLQSSVRRATSFQWQQRPAPQGPFGSGAVAAGSGSGQRGWQQGRTPAASPQDLSNVLWALAAQQFRPGIADMHSLAQACMQCLHGFEPNELCSVTWALAKLGYTPPAEQTHRLLEAVARAVSKCSAQGLCNVVWAVATLKLAPGQPWMQEILSNLVLKLEGCGPQELANLWWALGSMRWRLGPSLREELAGELRVNLHEFNPGETGMILWALARLELQPEPEVLLRQLQLICANSSSSSGGGGGLTRALDSAGPSSSGSEGLQPRTVAAVLWAVSEMERAVSIQTRGRGSLLGPCHREVLEQLLLKTLPGQGREAGTPWAPLLLPWSSRELALGFHSLGKLQLLPPEPWLLAAARQCRRLAAPLGPGTGAAVPAGAGAAAGNAAAGPGPAAAAWRLGGGMSARDAAMIAHGLAGVLQLMQVEAARPSCRRRLALAAWPDGRGAASPNAGHASTPRRWGAGRDRRALASRLRSLCVDRLVGCVAEDAGTALDQELVMLLSALPQLTGCLGLRKQVRWASVQARRRAAAGLVPLKAARGAGGADERRSRALVRSCGAGVRGLLAAAQARMERGGMSTREVASVASAAARMALRVDARFMQAVMSRCSDDAAAASAPARGPGGGPERLAEAQGPTCRDWVVCLWAMERLQPHHALLQGLQARTWVAQAAGNIVRLLSRPGRPVSSLGAGAERSRGDEAAGGGNAVGPVQAQLGDGVVHRREGHAEGVGLAAVAGHGLQAARPRALSRRVQRQNLWKRQQEQRRSTKWRHSGLPRLRGQQLLLHGQQRRALRQGHLATFKELQAAAAAAARLARSAHEAAEQAAAAAASAKATSRSGRKVVGADPGKGRGADSGRTVQSASAPRMQEPSHSKGSAPSDKPVAGGAAPKAGAAAEELSSLALQLQRASGLLRQVHWRRVYIGHASELKQVQQGSVRRPSHALN